MDIFALHERMTKHLFPAWSSEDERFLALALCGEAGELANMVKKRWRDGADLTEEIRDEIADIRVYLELLAKCFGIEGEKLDERVEAKLVLVVERHRARLDGSKCQWQPIETAPIDTAVLTYGFGFEVAHYNSMLKKWVANWDHRPIKPLFWCPLPAPPDLREQEQPQ